MSSSASSADARSSGPRAVDNADRSVRHPAQNLALAIGAAYTLAGLAGFLVTGFEGFAEVTNRTLLGFEVNPLHNIVHLVIGLTGVALSRTRPGARTYGILLAVGYGAAVLYGLAAIQNDAINFLSLNAADQGLHLVSVIAGVVMALWAAPNRVQGT